MATQAEELVDRRTKAFRMVAGGAGWGAEDVARILSISKSQAYRIIKGTSHLTPENAERIAEAARAEEMWSDADPGRLVMLLLGLQVMPSLRWLRSVTPPDDDGQHNGDAEAQGFEPWKGVNPPYPRRLTLIEGEAA